MKTKLISFGVCGLLVACGTDGGTFTPNPSATYRVGDSVDLNRDGIPDGLAVDANKDGIADGVDTNGDGMADQPLPSANGTPADAGAGSDSGLWNTAYDSGLPLGVDASVNGIPDGSCAAITDQSEVSRGPVDIVLVLDTSGSMAGQICNVSKNLTAFANGVGATAHVVTVYEMGVLGLITAGLCGGYDPLSATPLAMDATRYLHDSANVDSWNALSMLVQEFDKYKSFLRQGAPTHFVVVTDDRSFPMTAAEFKPQMEAKLGHPFTFHSIVADGSPDCLGSGAGTEYLTLSAQTGGQKMQICAQDWSMLFTQLQAAVVASAPLPCDFAIPMPTGGDKLNPDEVQVAFTPVGGVRGEFPRTTSMDQCASAEAWYYDNATAPTRIELCPQACTKTKTGGAIGIAFGCAPSVLR